MVLLGFPVFIWFGIAAFTGFIVTAYLGFNRKFRYHKTAALVSLGLAAIHILGALGAY